MEARALKVALWVRVLFASVALFLPLGHPHVWRQVDTLGVTLRYWLRWTVEPAAPWPLLPAVLQSGDGSGVMAMEWPLLNIVFAPLFQFGPEIGTALARGLLFALNMGLVLWNLRIWQGSTPAGVDARRSFRWMPLIGLGLIFFPKFIPDATAMLLVLAGTGFLFQTRQRVRAGFLLLTGFLMKPTAVIVLALLWLAPAPFSALLYAAPALLVSFLLTGFYYFKGMNWIQAVSGNESIYRVSPQNPWASLQAFFAAKTELGDLLLQGLGFYAGLPLLLVVSLWRRLRHLLLPWGLLALQILTIALLDGAHSFKHRYYFMGTLPLLCLIFQSTLEHSGPRLRAVFLVLLFGSAATYLAYEWRPFYIPTPADRFLSFRDCAALKAQLRDWPWQQAAVFRTTPRQYPLVGLCFGERVGSEQSRYGLYVAGDPIPADCRVVAKAGQVLGATCGF